MPVGCVFIQAIGNLPGVDHAIMICVGSVLQFEFAAHSAMDTAMVMDRSWQSCCDHKRHGSFGRAVIGNIYVEVYSGGAAVTGSHTQHKGVRGGGCSIEIKTIRLTDFYYEVRSFFSIYVIGIASSGFGSDCHVVLGNCG